MVNVNVRRITIAGQVARVMETYENGIYTYKIGIQKVDGGIWVVNISEDLYFKTLKHDDFVFELAMVFDNDDMYGKVDTELSKVEAVYVKGKDISEEDYATQQESDKSWLMTTENLETIHVEKKKSVFKSFGWIFLIAAGLTYFAISAWIDNIGDCRQYSSTSTAYFLGVIAIAFDLGAIALVLMTINKTASKYFRLLIPICLIVFSAITAIMCGTAYHIGTFIFAVVLILMLFVRIKKGFGYTGEANIMIGGQKI